MSRSHALFTVYVDSMIKGEDGHIPTRHGKSIESLKYLLDKK